MKDYIKHLILRGDVAERCKRRVWNPKSNLEGLLILPLNQGKLLPFKHTCRSQVVNLCSHLDRKLNSCCSERSGNLTSYKKTSSSMDGKLSFPPSTLCACSFPFCTKRLLTLMILKPLSVLMIGSFFSLLLFHFPPHNTGSLTFVNDTHFS